MIIYYSWSGNTKAYAEELAIKKGLSVFQLEEKKGRTGKLSFLRACLQGISRKQIEVVALPDISSCTEIFVCAPIWAGSAAPAVRYFLNHSDLSGKRVTFLFTCGGMTEPEVLQNEVERLLKDKGCSIGTIYSFTARFKQAPEPEMVKKNIEEAVN